MLRQFAKDYPNGIIQYIFLDPGGRAHYTPMPVLVAHYMIRDRDESYFIAIDKDAPEVEFNFMASNQHHGVTVQSWQASLNQNDKRP